MRMQIIKTKPYLARHVKKRRHIRDFFIQSKEGVITGSADNDPAGVVTYTQVGASTGFSQLWLLLLTLPMLTYVEEMSARVGVVTKKGLNAVIAKYYGLKLALLISLIVAVANVVTIGADLAGMAAVAGLLTGFSAVFLTVFFGLLMFYLLLSKDYAKVTRVFLILTPLFLLYVFSGVLSHPDWLIVAKNTFLPHFESSASWLALAVALLGTTLSPYLIFWQTTEEVEEKKTVKELRSEGTGVFTGMLYSHFIFYFIIVASAAVLYGKVAGIETPLQAARALTPLAGPLAGFLFSVGIIISGLLAVPVLTASTAYTIADALPWQEGLDKPVFKAGGFYLIISLALAVGVVISIVGVSPIKMLVASQVLNGFLMPALLFILVLVSNRKDIMREHQNGFWSNFFAVLAIVVFVALDLLLLASWFR